jgi:hypothetical protein
MCANVVQKCMQILSESARARVKNVESRDFERKKLFFEKFFAKKDFSSHTNRIILAQETKSS